MRAGLRSSSTIRTTPHRPLTYNPVTHPSFGIDPTGEFLEDEYEEGEESDYDLEEEIAKLAELDPESDDEDLTTMAGDTWPSAVPNRLDAPNPITGSTTSPDDPRLSCLGLPLSLPYEVESLAEMDDRLEYIVSKLLECVAARDFHTGFSVWDSALSIWMSMGYPMKREVKIKLIFLYYELMFLPGMASSSIDDAGNQFLGLISDRSLTIHDFRIPWRPLYDILYQELFPEPDRPTHHHLAALFLNIAEVAQRFFHPGDVDEMLETMLPRLQPTMDSILATQTFLVHFLPISHCQTWLPVIFRLWYGLNSGLWDDQASDLMGQLAIAHVTPSRSDPSLIAKIPRGTHNTPEEEANNPNHKRIARGHRARLADVAGEVIEDEDGVSFWAKPEVLPEEPEVADPSWEGIRKDIGIFTEQEFEFLMSKCLRSLNVPVGGNLAASNAMSVTMADSLVSKKILDAKKPIDRVQSLAETIIFCMSEDAPIATTASGNATPGTATPIAPAIARLQNGASVKKSGSTDSLALAGKKSEENRKYLGGSKALDHLSRLLTSCETYFHPSNSGHWTSFLTVFLSHLTSNFVERWKGEQEPTCKTPQAWRLTPEIKREFVLCLRPLALTAMFNKNLDSVTATVGALKRLALLEPDLIMPALMDRAVPSLQGLEETQRTTAVTYALATVAQVLTGRQIWRLGGIYVGDILNLLLPGIDLNDPSKTGLCCMAITHMTEFIRLSDISEVEGANDVKPGVRALRQVPRLRVEDDEQDPNQNELDDLSSEDINDRVRFTTSLFRDWVPEFLGRVLLLFSNLPEEGGKSGRAGGKIEAMTVQSVLQTCGGVFMAVDEKLYDVILDQVIEYITTTCQASAVDSVGELVRHLASANAPRAFEKLFPICRQRILSELKGGASSLRTQTTSIPRASDAALHWWQAILLGILIPGRVVLSADSHRHEIVDLLRTMVASTYSERGWAWTGKVMEKAVSCLTSIYFSEMKMLNPDDYESEDFKLNHTLWWGKMYRATEIKPSWRRLDPADIDMAFEILEIADQCTTRINELMQNRLISDNTWSNDFCRSLNLIEKVLRGSHNLFAEIEARKVGGKKPDVYMPLEMLQLPKPFKSGLILTKEDDPRYERVLAIRQRIGEALNNAASVLRDAGESDNSVENIRLLVSAIGTLLTAYGVRSKQFSAAQTAYSGIMQAKKLYESQRKHTRSIFLAAASVHHQNRLTTLAYYRVRSALDDKLIVNLLDFCLSPFTRIRRASQNWLDIVARLYRGVWCLCYPKLYDALQVGSDPDRMKGALYVLRYNHVGLSRIVEDWRQIVPMTEALLNAHHENKASVQALVAKATEEFISMVRPLVLLKAEPGREPLDAAAGALADIITVKPSLDVVKKLNDRLWDFRSENDTAYDVFVDRVVAKASIPTLNWRYALWASKLLYNTIRRDRPTDTRIAKFYAANVQNAHPRLRDYGLSGTIKLLMTVVLRSLCEDDEARLLTLEPYDRSTTEIELTDTSRDFTERYLASFREPLPEDDSHSQLQDRVQTGWLAWGKTAKVFKLAGWEETTWNVDPKCRDGLEVYQQAMSTEGWWEKVAEYWAQEDTRNYPSASHIDFVLCFVQIFPMPMFDAIRPIAEAFLAEMEATKVYDRHKMRALWELLAGLLRGSEDWPGKDRKVLWEWFTPLLPVLFANIRHDTTKCWDLSIEYLLNEKDPRRYKPLVDFCVDTARNADFQGGSAFDLARRVQLVRSLVTCLGWRFVAWGGDFVDLYFKSLSCPYDEVRGLIASVLNAADKVTFYPSYSSTGAFVKDVLADTSYEKDIMHIRSGTFEPQLKHILDSLPIWKQERPHGPKAVLSTHDTSATTTLQWLSIELTDIHAVGTFPYLIPMLPAIFELRDLNDNVALQRVAGRLLAMITSITPSLDLIDPLMDALISILKDSVSWRTKIHSMPVLSLVYFRNLSLLSETCKAKCLDVVSACLKDPNQEVREMASTTLSGFLRCSQRAMVVVLKDRFTREIKSITLPKRRDAPGQVNPEYQAKLVELHGAILGATALVEAFPYTVPKFLPKLLADVLAPRASEPAPISTTIRSCVASFKRTHEKYQDKFSEDELSSMNYAQAGNSYYA